MLKKKYYGLCLALCFACIMDARAEVVIIVHSSNQASMTQAYIKRVFLGKVVAFPGGEKAVPINIESGTKVRKEFERKILKKSDPQIRSYWAKRIFTGKGIPPKETSLSEIIQLISSDPTLIGYTEISNVNEKVRVIGKY